MSLQILYTQKVSTVASPEIQAIIQSRIEGFPEKAQTMMHWAKCSIPEKTCLLLKQKPQILGLAIEAFCNRDSKDMKKTTKLPIQFNEQTNQRVLIKFNKYHYAKLKSIPFYPPKPFSLPPSTHPDYNAIDLGFKLTFGVEILCSGDPTTLNLNESSSSGELVLCKSVGEGQEDDEKWMEVSPEQVDDMLLAKQKEIDEYYKNVFQKAEGRKNETHDGAKIPSKLTSVVSQLQKFIQKTSSIDGVDPEGPDVISDDENEISGDSEDSGAGMDSEEEVERDEEMIKLMEEMDMELRGTSVGESFERFVKKKEQNNKEGKSNKGLEEDQEEADDDDDDGDVDEEMNLMKNLLSSLAEQQGAPGPLSNMLRMLNPQ